MDHCSQFEETELQWLISNHPVSEVVEEKNSGWAEAVFVKLWICNRLEGLS